jgi:hypothetical protein
MLAIIYNFSDKKNKAVSSHPSRNAQLQQIWRQKQERMQRAVNYINQLNNNKKLNISTKYYLSSGADLTRESKNKKILKKTT